MKVKSFRRIFLISALLALLICTTAFAARKEGWVEKGTSIRYYAVNEEGKKERVRLIRNIAKIRNILSVERCWNTDRHRVLTHLLKR